jgi:hypothetical protein
MVGLTHICLESNGSNSSVEAKLLVACVSVLTVPWVLPAATLLLRHHQRVKDEACQHQGKQSLTTRLESALLQLHGALSNNRHLSRAKEQPLEECHQVGLLMRQLNLHRLGGGRRTRHLQPKHAYLESQVQMVGVVRSLTEHSAQKGTVSESQAGGVRDLMGSCANSSLFPLQ